ncbi:MAG: HIT domain-containing protein [Geodermatophilaceae bacterium]|jgi:histidine triad (HIT) family protein|nr:HIT domain-containing protein [Geodermatophilaceae bacterium]
MRDCLFCGIAAGDTPATLVLERPRTLGFRDLNPQAPTHVLVITRDHHADVGTLAHADPTLMAELMATGHDVAVQEGITGTGYRSVFNSGRDAHQSVQHVHLHVLGGRDMGWPPG